MIFRPATDPDLAGLMPLLVPDPASPLTAGHYQNRSGSHEYRPEWTWIAQEDADAPPADAGAPASASVSWNALLPRPAAGVFTSLLVTDGVTHGLADHLGGPARRRRARREERQ